MKFYISIFSLLLFVLPPLTLRGQSKSDNLKLEADKASAAADQESEIRKLVSELASKNSPPQFVPGRTSLEYPVDWDASAQEDVKLAKRKLELEGFSAFPILMENLDNERFSKTLSASREFNLSVGEVCKQLIESRLNIGMTYKSRKGADGRSHQCPDFFYEQYEGDVRKWWSSNSNETPTEIRYKAVKWQIAEENRIGFPDIESKGLYLQPLLKELKSLEAARMNKTKVSGAKNETDTVKTEPKQPE